MIETETLDFMDQMIKIQERIAEALESLNTNLLPIIAKGIGNILREETMLMKKEGEVSVIESKPESGGTELKVNPSNLKPLPKITKVSPGFDMPKTKVVETINYIDVRECKDYSEKSYKLIGYDMEYCFPAKQHISAVTQLKEGGTRVIFKSECVWAKDSLEWK